MLAYQTGDAHLIGFLVAGFPCTHTCATEIFSHGEMHLRTSGSVWFGLMLVSVRQFSARLPRHVCCAALRALCKECFAAGKAQVIMVHAPGRPTLP